MIPERNGFLSPRGDHNGNPIKPAGNSRGKVKQGSMPQGVKEEARDLPLVDEDGLCFRVIAGVRDALATQDFDPAVLAEGFRGAFTGVWKRLPPADRHRLLVYWQHGPDARLPATHAHDKNRGPLIRVVCEEATPEVVLAGWGTQITFPASLVVARPRRLVGEIARTMAQAFRLATREHWGLIQTVIEEPLELWEREQGTRATEAKRDKKVNALETEYVEKYEASVIEIVRGWGLGTPEG